MTTATKIASVQEQVMALFATELQVEVPSPDTDLLATGSLDSLGVVELLLQLEKVFGITVEIEDLELEHFRSVSAIVGFVTGRMNAVPGPRASAQGDASPTGR